MIYLVTTQQELFKSNIYKIIGVEESLRLLNSLNIIGLDTETNGRDAHINQLLCVQLGNKEVQVVIDCSTIDIKLYKKCIEDHFIIFQNGSFDLQFLYNYGIIPLKVYDTMIVEQFLHLGYPPGTISYSLKEIAWRRLSINLDKTIRGQIIWRGLDSEVIKYAASDVEHLEDIMRSQLLDIEKIPNGKIGAKLECDFIPVLAYLEWCGIKLDAEKWQLKMIKDQENLNKAIEDLNNFVVNTPSLKKFTYVNLQGDLWEGFDTTPKVTINWSSSQQVIKVAKILGFNTIVQDKKTGEDKDSVLEKSLSIQKGINDEFLKLYFKYQEYAKVVSSFGQGHLDAINPITGRIHTKYKALGAASGRMSCGSNQPNTDLAKYKKLPKDKCKYNNLQQLPSDELTRSCFIPEKGNLMIDCDWAAAEARLSGDIYNDQAIKDIFLNNIDSHSMYAKIFFKEELKDIDVKDIKKLRPDLRQKAKGPEFALNFGGGIFAIKQAIQCTEAEAEEIIKNYEKGFRGTAEFAKKGSKFVREHGYVVMNKYTGHRMYWWDWKEWKKRQESFTSEFWEDYKLHHKGTGDAVHLEVKQHFKAASKWDRMARNAPTQGTCATMLKYSQIALYKYIVANNLWGKYKLCALVHDECLWEVPEDKAQEFAKIIEDTMLNAAAQYCKSLPIPAEAEVADHWKH